MDKTTQIVLIIFTAAILVSVLIQLGAVLGMFIATRKMQKKVNALVEDLRIHVLPVVRSSRTTIEDLAPKIKVISSNLVDTSHRARATAEDVSGTVKDLLARTRAQAAHVDGMVQGTLEQITQTGNTIQRGISGPLRQINGILNGLRAGINVMCQKPPARREGQDDLFI